MSIKTRIELFSHLRIAATLDTYGYKSDTPELIKENVEISMSKNTFDVSNTNPLYTQYEYVGITKYKDIVEGDLIEDANDLILQVKKIGNACSQYVMFLEVWQK